MVRPRNAPLEYLDGGNQKRQRRQTGRSDRGTLRHRLHGVADRVGSSVIPPDLAFGRLLITAIPPALSVIGPGIERDNGIPAIDSMLTTAIAIP